MSCRAHTGSTVVDILLSSMVALLPSCLFPDAPSCKRYVGMHCSTDRSGSDGLQGVHTSARGTDGRVLGACHTNAAHTACLRRQTVRAMPAPGMQLSSHWGIWRRSTEEPGLGRKRHLCSTPDGRRSAFEGDFEGGAGTGPRGRTAGTLCTFAIVDRVNWSAG